MKKICFLAICTLSCGCWHQLGAWRDWPESPENITSAAHGYKAATNSRFPATEDRLTFANSWIAYDTEGWIMWPSILNHRWRNPRECLDAVVDSPNPVARDALARWYASGPMSSREKWYAFEIRPEIGAAILVRKAAKF